MKYVFPVLITLLAENYVFTRAIGLDGLLGTSADRKTSFRLSLITVFSSLISVICAYVADKYFLSRFGLGYVKYFIVLLVCSAVVQCVVNSMKRKYPGRYVKIGPYLPLAAVNGTAIGIMAQITTAGLLFWQTVLYAFLIGAGVTVASLILGVVLENVRYSDVPGAFRGLPITLVSAALLALLFMGFSGLDLPV